MSSTTSELPPVPIVGVGPGHPAYLTRRARSALGTADVVVGFETVVEYVADETDADRLTCSYDDQTAVLTRFAERVAAGERGVAVAMGDPGVSGATFVARVERALDRPVRIVPGVSSVQVAAARTRTPLEDATFVTLHRRGPLEDDLDRLVADVGTRHLLVLPRPYDWMPEDVAEHLLRHGAPASLRAVVLERLTHDDEAITRTTLADLAGTAGDDSPDGTPFSDLSILVVRREAP